MGTRKHNHARLSGFALGLALAACGGDSESKPPDAGGSNHFTDDDASSSEHEDAGGAHTDAGGTHDDAGSEDAAAGDAGAEAGASCEGKDGCYECEPATNEQFLNSCAEGCRPFDESKYPSQWAPGEKLPDLP